MKNLKITGFFAVLILVFLLISGCTNTNATPVAVSTPTPQIVYVTVLVTQTQKASPVLEEHTVTLSFADYMGNSLVGADVSATPISTTSSTGNLGMGTQHGTTDTSGRVVFTMSSTIKYDLVITYQGKKTYDTIYPSSSYYYFPIR